MSLQRALDLLIYNHIYKQGLTNALKTLETDILFYFNTAYFKIRSNFRSIFGLKFVFDILSDFCRNNVRAMDEYSPPLAHPLISEIRPRMSVIRKSSWQIE